ncbi:MAG: hypothetical protein HW405_134 [Candidatus Berkelbacteria bacterium]|nr:hypothetical protein [Candidatus Berkelbacteria bacterium]
MLGTDARIVLRLVHHDWRGSEDVPDHGIVVEAVEQNRHRVLLRGGSVQPGVAGLVDEVGGPNPGAIRQLDSAGRVAQLMDRVHHERVQLLRELLARIATSIRINQEMCLFCPWTSHGRDSLTPVTLGGRNWCAIGEVPVYRFIAGVEVAGWCPPRSKAVEVGEVSQSRLTESVLVVPVSLGQESGIPCGDVAEAHVNLAAFSHGDLKAGRCCCLPVPDGRHDLGDEVVTRQRVPLQATQRTCIVGQMNNSSVDRGAVEPNRPASDHRLDPVLIDPVGKLVVELADVDPAALDLAIDDSVDFARVAGKAHRRDGGHRLSNTINVERGLLPERRHLLVGGIGAGRGCLGTNLGVIGVGDTQRISHVYGPSEDLDFAQVPDAVSVGVVKVPDDEDRRGKGLALGLEVVGLRPRRNEAELALAGRVLVDRCHPDLVDTTGVWGVGVASTGP